MLTKHRIKRKIKLPGHMGRKYMILSYEDFRDEFTKEVFESAKAVSTVKTVEKKEIFKSNRGLTEALAIQLEGMNIAPMIYPYDAYERYSSGERNVKAIAREMLEWALSAAKSRMGFDFSGICPENASDHLYLQILNGERNRDFAQSTAHLTLHDLIAVPRWKIGDGSILCSREFQKEFLNFSDEELLETALAGTVNCEFTIRGMLEYLGSFSGDELKFEERMYIVFGKGSISGAAALFSQKMLEKICIAVEDENYYVIPSSVNEIIAVPEWAVDDPSYLLKTCREVNSTSVDPEDFLSDNIYKYESAAGKLTLPF